MCHIAAYTITDAQASKTLETWSSYITSNLLQVLLHSCKDTWRFNKRHTSFPSHLDGNSSTSTLIWTCHEPKMDSLLKWLQSFMTTRIASMVHLYNSCNHHKSFSWMKCRSGTCLRLTEGCVIPFCHPCIRPTYMSIPSIYVINPFSYVTISVCIYIKE